MPLATIQEVAVNPIRAPQMPHLPQLARVGRSHVRDAHGALSQ